MKNPNWSVRVRGLMAEGCGYDDIAVKLACSPDLVRREAARLRENGQLVGLYTDATAAAQARLEARFNSGAGVLL